MSLSGEGGTSRLSSSLVQLQSACLPSSVLSPSQGERKLVRSQALPLETSSQPAPECIPGHEGQLIKGKLNSCSSFTPHTLLIAKVPYSPLPLMSSKWLVLKDYSSRGWSLMLGTGAFSNRLPPVSMPGQSWHRLKSHIPICLPAIPWLDI